MSSEAGRLALFTVVAMCTGCADQIVRVEPSGRDCVDVRWPLSIPTGAGPTPNRSAGPFHPPRPCASLADCPPGAYCVEGESGATCRTRSLPVVQGSLAESLGVPTFDVEVVADGDGHRLSFSRLPPPADFAVCAFHACPVDGDILALDDRRCLLETVRVDLRAADGVPLPPASATSRRVRVQQTACGDGAALKLTPTGFAVACIAYRPSGIAGASTLLSLTPEQVGSLAGDTYQTRCSAATTGSACLHPRSSANELGICVGDACCMRCVGSTPTGSLVEQVCASISDQVVDTPDPRYVQMGYSRYGVCFGPDGQALCLDDDFVPADAPDPACVPRAEPRLDVASPREYDADGDGVSVDLDCDDRDPGRGAITFEATADGIDQDCDGRIDEVTVRPCEDDPDMVAAWDGATCIDRYEASRPDATATTPGRAVGPARSRPGVMPWVDVTWPVAEAACAAAGKALCDPTTHRHNCLHASGSPFPYGPGYNADACNGADGLFGALIPTGTLNGCAGQSGAVDLVGNAAEWTASGAVLGGSFMSGSTDLSCQSSRRYEPADTIADERFAAPWLGFRCCRAPDRGTP